MIRIFDILLALIAILIFAPLAIILYLIIYLDNKSPLFYQKRVGKKMKEFTLIKFRTMSKGTKSCATHLVENSRITKFGKLLRKSKLDELPQLWNVLKGEMSLVGPRPCLPNQFELIDIRRRYHLYEYLPGITGLAQIKGIDMSNPILLSQTDSIMMKNLNFSKYFYYLFLTFLGSGFGDKVKNK
tara:strand:- start:45 stop:599 length:555 start_codon:yes stop_codon:yes gene_type:complete